MRTKKQKTLRAQFFKKVYVRIFNDTIRKKALDILAAKMSPWSSKNIFGSKQTTAFILKKIGP
tara:strand:+ start:435 stop:623 length:189 start_codon:yes stop_codon:yes gene_type:complete